jgi:hypothetical protein
VSTRLDPVFACELATGRVDRDGYAYHGKSRAHIVAWEKAHGRVTDDMELDHMCRRRACCAVIHLEPVTRSENERRKDWSYRVKRQTCAQGHDLRIYRVITPERGVLCRRCNQEALRRRGVTT